MHPIWIVRIFFFFFNTAKAELTASQTGVVCVCVGGRMQNLTDSLD